MVKKIISITLCFLVALGLFSIPASAAGCSHLQWYQLCPGHTCFAETCDTYPEHYSENHSYGHGCNLGHAPSQCCCGHSHDCPHDPCYHTCKTCHKDHCTTCHQSPCVCYPASSTITVPAQYFIDATTITVSSPRASFHNLYDSDKQVIDKKDGATVTFTVNSNGTYYTRPYNAVGANPTYQKIEIVTIDKNAPTAPTLTKNPETRWNNNDVSVIAEGSVDTESGIQKYQMKIDNGAWQDTDMITATESCIVHARAFDVVGNISSTASAIVEIDRVLPINGDVTTSYTSKGYCIFHFDVEDDISGITDEIKVSTWLTKDRANTLVEKTLTYSEVISELHKKGMIAVDTGMNSNVNFKDYIEATFEVKDIAGNVLRIDIPQFLSDNIPPTRPSFTRVPGFEWHNGDVIAKVSDSVDLESGMQKYQMKVDDGEWQDTDTITATKSCTVYGRAVDNAENISQVVTTKIKIDRTIPVSGTLVKFPATEWSKNNVMVSLEGSKDNESGIRYRQIKIGDGEWKNVSKARVTENCTVYARVSDIAGNVSETLAIPVKIDKTPPTVFHSFETSSTQNGIMLTITAVDEESGVQEIKAENQSAILAAQHKFEILETGTHNFVVKDKVGNATRYSVTVNTDIPTLPAVVDVNVKKIKEQLLLTSSKVNLNWSNEPIEVSVYSYAKSGIKGYRYRPKNNLTSSWKTSENGMLKVAGEGIFSYELYAVDTANKKSETITITIKNDFTMPKATADLKGNALTITASDKLSGISTISCSCDTKTENKTVSPMSLKQDTNSENLSTSQYNGSKSKTCTFEVGTTEHRYIITDIAGNKLVTTKVVIIEPPQLTGSDNIVGSDTSFETNRESLLKRLVTALTTTSHLTLFIGAIILLGLFWFFILFFFKKDKEEETEETPVAVLLQNDEDTVEEIHETKVDKETETEVILVSGEIKENYKTFDTSKKDCKYVIGEDVENGIFEDVNEDYLNKF